MTVFDSQQIEQLKSMGFNVFLYGPPGTGKTAMLHDMARSKGMTTEEYAESLGLVYRRD